MKNYLLLLLLIPGLLSFTVHKYYLSVMDLEYNEETGSVQIITRLFYDDLEDVLNERYQIDLILDATQDQDEIDLYLQKYLTQKVNIKVNGNNMPIDYIGKEYEDDYVVCYLEITDVKAIKSFLITNELLMDLFPEQKNMVHTSIYKNEKSFLLINGNAKAMLNFSE